MIATDQHIIQLLQKGDKNAISLIYDKWAGPLYGMILNICRDEKIAEDVLQESLTNVWMNSHKYDATKAKLFTWIYRITKNKAIDQYRKIEKKRTIEIQEAQLNVSPLHSDSLLLNTELKTHIDQLEPKYKEVVHELFFGGLTQQEFADQSGIPLGTIKSRLRIALRELRKVYTPSTLILFIIMCYYGG